MLTRVLYASLSSQFELHTFNNRLTSLRDFSGSIVALFIPLAQPIKLSILMQATRHNRDASILYYAGEIELKGKTVRRHGMSTRVPTGAPGNPWHACIASARARSY